jgi:hypothetical protein
MVLSLACLVLLAFGIGQGQPQSEQPPRIPPPGLGDPLVPPAVTPPAPPTVEDLVNRLEKLRKQKTDIEKQEQAIVEQLRARYQAHTEALIKLGILPPPNVPKVGQATPPNPATIEYSVPVPPVKDAPDKLPRPQGATK